MKTIMIETEHNILLTNGIGYDRDIRGYLPFPERINNRSIENNVNLDFDVNRKIEIDQDSWQAGIHNIARKYEKVSVL